MTRRIDFLAACSALDFAPGGPGRGVRVRHALPADDRPDDGQGHRGHGLLSLNRLIALNEVGGEPDARRAARRIPRRDGGAHEQAAARPLSATATHDTKRGEDARARLYALSEMPDAWARRQSLAAA